jgi:hypothetical protein
MRIYNFIHSDYFTRRDGTIIPMTHENYFSVGQEEQPTREELIDAFYKLTHNRYWNRFIRVILVTAAGLITYALLSITSIPKP